jgi:hypothetical protein
VTLWVSISRACSKRGRFKSASERPLPASPARAKRAPLSIRSIASFISWAGDDALVVLPQDDVDRSSQAGMEDDALQAQEGQDGEETGEAEGEFGS